MKIENISISLFEFISYFIPGSIIILSLFLIIVEFGIDAHSYFNLMDRYWYIAIILAYFLGELSHAISSFIKYKLGEPHKTDTSDMSEDTLQAIKRLIQEVYSLPDSFDPTLDREFEIDYFYLADSYLNIHKETSNTDIYRAQEGFYRSSIPALIIFAISCWLKIFILQTSLPKNIELIEVVPVLGFLLSIGLIIVCRERTLFFNRKKNIHILTQFYSLALKLNPRYLNNSDDKNA